MGWSRIIAPLWRQRSLAPLPSRRILLAHYQSSISAATTAAATIYFSLNVLITSTIISLRDGESVAKLLRSVGGAYLTMLALAPVAWLMARMYIARGVVGSAAVRPCRYSPPGSPIAASWKSARCSPKPVSSLAEAVDKRDKFTSGHSHRVQEIAMDIGRVMKVSDDETGGTGMGRPPPRHRQDRRAGLGAAQAGAAHGDEAGDHELAPGPGRGNHCPVKYWPLSLPLIRHHTSGSTDRGYPDRLVGDRIPKLARILQRRRCLRGDDGGPAVSHDAAHARAGAD